MSKAPIKIESLMEAALWKSCEFSLKITCFKYNRKKLFYSYARELEDVKNKILCQYRNQLWDDI